MSGGHGDAPESSCGTSSELFEIYVLDDKINAKIEDMDAEEEEDEGEEWTEYEPIEEEVPRRPLVPGMIDPTMRSTSPSKFTTPARTRTASSRATESLSEKIRREQRELREEFEKASERSPEKLDFEAFGDDDASPSPTIKYKLDRKGRKIKNRNQSAKTEKIRVLEPSGEIKEPATSSSTSTSTSTATQTEISLKHTQRDVVWTPSVLAEVIDVASDLEDNEMMESESEKEDIKVGKGWNAWIRSRTTTS